jgi:two-component system, chemotaxis family, response regulator Rcp1
MTARSGISQVRILLVEDNPGDVELLRLALMKAGLDCDLTVLDDGAEALELVRQQGKYADAPAPDLAVLDLNVPKYDGIEILEAMRANPAFAHVRVAVLSSSSSPRERANIEKFHVSRYITKPLDLDEFLKIGVILKELLVDGASRGFSSGA